MKNEIVKGEVWKDVPGYDGDYQVSDQGRVRSFKKHREGIMKPAHNTKGYLHIGFYKDAKRKGFIVHRLVMLVFKGESNLTVDHLNGIRDDNRLENLEYVTNRENVLRGKCCKVKRKGASSKYMGVSRDVKRNTRWRSVAVIKGKRFYLGNYDTEEEAHEVYIKFKKERGLLR